MLPSPPCSTSIVLYYHVLRPVTFSPDDSFGSPPAVPHHLDDVDASIPCGVEDVVECMDARGAVDSQRLETYRYGVVLDLHFMQKSALEAGLTTSWKPDAFESLLVNSLDEGRRLVGTTGTLRAGAIASRTAADSIVPHGPKKDLHKRLKDAGYTLELSPNKRARMEQGATDVVIACVLHELAGAFEPFPCVDEIVLVSGDSDFWPCISRLLDRRPSLKICVCATRRKGLRKEYLKWIEDDGCDRRRFVELQDILQHMGGSTKVNFERLAKWNGIRPNYEDIWIALHRGLQQHATSGDSLSLNVSFNAGLWGDEEMIRLCDDLLAMMDEASEHVQLGELWVHHTSISDSCCPKLAELIRRCSHLAELHISDTHITSKGLASLLNACDARDGQLYINISHIRANKRLRKTLDLGPRTRTRDQYPTRNGKAMVRLQGPHQSPMSKKMCPSPRYSPSPKKTPTRRGTRGRRTPGQSPQQPKLADARPTQQGRSHKT